MSKIENIYLEMLQNNTGANGIENEDYNNICNELNSKYNDLTVNLNEIQQLMENAKVKAGEIHGDVAIKEYDENINKLQEFIKFSQFMTHFFESNEVIDEDIMSGDKRYYTSQELKSLFIKNIISFCQTHKLDPSEFGNNYAVCNDAMQEVNKMCNPTSSTNTLEQ